MWAVSKVLMVSSLLCWAREAEKFHLGEIIACRKHGTIRWSITRIDISTIWVCWPNSLHRPSDCTSPRSPCFVFQHASASSHLLTSAYIEEKNLVVHAVADNVRSISWEVQVSDSCVVPTEFFHRLELHSYVVSINFTISRANSTNCVSWVELDLCNSFAYCITNIASFCDSFKVVV